MNNFIARLAFAGLLVCAAPACRPTENPEPPEQLNEGLIAAVRTDRADEVQRLIARGANVDVLSTGGKQQAAIPLIVACERGRSQIVQLLLQAGANPNRREGGGDFGNTPLIVAARFGHAEVVRTLLDHGANPFARSGPLQVAPAAGAVGSGVTALDEAVVYGHDEAARQLLLAGASASPFHLYSAITNGRVGLVRLVLASGVDPMSRFPWNGRTALEEARLLESDTRAEILATLERAARGGRS